MHTLKALSFSYCSAKSTFQKGDGNLHYLVGNVENYDTLRNWFL